ncbi:MAG: hypothetical protein LW854_23580, partial [Rubrivivax sp.]|nr:hypothetical protein [Rubrivivax sp.]
ASSTSPATDFDVPAMAEPASSFDDTDTTHMLEPAFNIDGTPMLGSFDIHGNPYGVTEPISDGSLSHMGMSDDFGGAFDSSSHATSLGSNDFGGASGFDCTGSGWN